MITLRNILVAIDFSATSRTALAYGRMLADATGGALHLVHVIGHPVEHPETTGLDRMTACHRLETLLDETDRRVRRATTVCLVGPTAPVLAAYARDRGIDLLVMGTHHHDPSVQMVTGSTAGALVGMAPCAVLAVKDGAAREAPWDPPPASVAHQ